MGDQPERRDNTVLQAVLDLTNKVSEVQVELGKNTTETKNIGIRLDKLNGSVAEHARPISTLDRAVEVHTQTIASLARAEDTKMQFKTNLQELLYKGLIVVALLLFYTLLTHTGIVKDFLK